MRLRMPQLALIAAVAVVCIAFPLAQGTRDVDASALAPKSPPTFAERLLQLATAGWIRAAGKFAPLEDEYQQYSIVIGNQLAADCADVTGRDDHVSWVTSRELPDKPFPICNFNAKIHVKADPFVRTFGGKDYLVTSFNSGGLTQCELEKSQWITDKDSLAFTDIPGVTCDYNTIERLKNGTGLETWHPVPCDKPGWCRVIFERRKAEVPKEPENPEP